MKKNDFRFQALIHGFRVLRPKATLSGKKEWTTFDIRITPQQIQTKITAINMYECVQNQMRRAK